MWIFWEKHTEWPTDRPTDRHTDLTYNLGTKPLSSVQPLGWRVWGWRRYIFHIFLDMYSLRLPLYLLGKFGSTVAFTVLYIISSELFPTPLRHSLIGACSMFGRFGSMAAPQMPLLVCNQVVSTLVIFKNQYKSYFT